MAHSIRALAAGIGIYFVCLTAAWAPGSIGLDEILNMAQRSPKLVKEIEATLKNQNMDAADVTCYGTRLGRQWTYLSAERTLPFTCEIGNRTLTIDGDLDFLDAQGKVIPRGLENPRIFTRAREIKTGKLTWEWGNK